MRKIIINFFKGVIVGLANIIPGVSGGTMMVSMGLYNRLIWSITHIFSRSRKAIHFLWPIFLGAGVAIVLFSRLFSYLLSEWSVPTSLAFCGLVLGSVPALSKEINFKKRSLLCLACFLIFFILVVFSAVLARMSFDHTAGLSLGFLDLTKLFLVGIVAAATMVVPGVSGSMVLMVLGYYLPILSLISTSLDALRAFDFSLLMYNFALLAVFGLGVIVGIFLIAKGIEYLFRHFKNEVYFAILGLVLASPLAILIQADYIGFGWMQLIIGLIMLVLCFFGSYKLSEL